MPVNMITGTRQVGLRQHIQLGTVFIKQIRYMKPSAKDYLVVSEVVTNCGGQRAPE